jgi:hypothetical protein
MGAKVSGKDFLNDMADKAEQGVQASRAGDLHGALTLLGEVHIGLTLWWDPGSDDVVVGRRVVQIRRQLCLLQRALGELDEAMEVGVLAIGAANAVLAALDRAGSRPRDVVDEAAWTVLDVLQVALAVGRRDVAVDLLDTAFAWTAPGPAERLRRIHGRVLHDRAAYLSGRMRQPAPADQTLALEQVQVMMDCAGQAVAVRRGLRDPSDPRTLWDLASSLQQVAEITTINLQNPSSGAEHLSLAAAELQVLRGVDPTKDILAGTPDLHGSDVPPRADAPDLPGLPARAVLLAEMIHSLDPAVVVRQRRVGHWPT